LRPIALRDAFDTPSLKRRYVRQLFATIAGRYDFITRFLSYGRDRHWKARLVRLAGIHQGSRVLDLACGTGDLAFEAVRHGAGVTGLDITPRMIALARSKRNGSRVHWVVGDMGQLPIASGVVDVVTTGYGLRNVPDLPAALREIHRVLVPGGVACSLDFNRPSTRWVRQVYLAYLTLVGSGLGWILHGDADTYRYIPASIRRYPGAHRVAGLMREAGFVSVDVIPVLGGLMAMHRFRK